METVKWKIKRFEALSHGEMYQMLQLRSEVFVVEQNCVYQDIDGKDSKALHLIGEYQGQVVAYARLFGKGDYFEDASIGRVVTKPAYRHLKIGHELMRQAIMALTTEWGPGTITISAQQHLKSFYESHGFVQTSPAYLEDDIPHIRMRRSL